MLRLLLDEHFSPTIADRVRAHNPAIDIDSVQHWRDGVYRGQHDSILLGAAHEERLTLVTYDQRTILTLIGQWGREGRSHSGLIMVSRKTMYSDDLGALVRGLLRLWGRRGGDDWTDSILYLTND